MDLRKLKTLIDLVSESGVAELEITEGDDRVKIVNRVGAAPVAAAAPACGCLRCSRSRSGSGCRSRTCRRSCCR